MIDNGTVGNQYERSGDAAKLANKSALSFDTAGLQGMLYHRPVPLGSMRTMQLVCARTRRNCLLGQDARQGTHSRGRFNEV